MIVHGDKVIFYVFIAIIIATNNKGNKQTNNEHREREREKKRVLGISWIGGIVATYLGHK